MNDLPRATVIPAQPGYYRLWVDPVTGALGQPEQLIAWELVTQPEVSRPSQLACHERPFMAVYMVTPGGRVDDQEYLLHPSGEVEHLEVQNWKSLDAANVATECAKRLSRG